MVDDSPSMNEKVSQVRDFLSSFKSVTKHKTQSYAFADSLLGLIKTDSIIIQGNRTDIAKSIKMVEVKKPGALVILSDGQNNAFTDPIQVSSQTPFPIYTIGFGRISEQDIGIRRLNAPRQIYLGETANVVLRITSQGFGSQRAKVSLYQGNSVLKNQEILLTDNLTEQELVFRLAPNEIGKMLYKVVINKHQNEDNLSNNEKEFGMTVLKSKLKIIVLSNSPSYNTRFLINTLKSEMFDISPVIAFQNNPFQMITDQGKRDFVFKLDCDVLILDNFDANRVSPDISNQIKKLVNDCAGILILWGEKSRMNPTFSDFLPFINNQRIVRKEIFTKLTDQGISVPIFYDQGENLLENTPPLLGLADIKDISKDAQIWAVAEPAGTPLIGFKKFGKGKVIEVSGFPIWRFGFYGNDLESAQKKFRQLLTQICRFLALRDFDRFSLKTDQSVYPSGENITFTFQAYQEDGKPWQGLDVNLVLSNEPDKIPMIEIASGIYEKTIKALSANNYIVRAVAMLDTQKVGEAKTEFGVSETNIEMIDTNLNSDLLERIAQVSGGEYFNAADFPATGIDFNLVKYQTAFKLDPRRSPYLYVILAVLFLIELYFRKRRGLM